MSRRFLRNLLIVAAVPTLGLGLATTPVLATPAPAPITDPKGDVYDEDDDEVDAPYGDIVRADGTRNGGNIELRYSTASAGDPTDDPNWESDETYTEFLLDTNGDNTEDYAIEYGVDDEGELYADVYKVGSDTPACTGTASYSGANIVTAPLRCIGTPTRVSYRVETAYDTDVDAEESVVGYDEAPDEGFAAVN
ncbi:hypothetical protein GCM10010123_39000 [Pilimelia anulata]|uniref:Secreted protein n=1 Tax=Pilimelia anulata TaxID=53371 RepID=A0A8J3BAN0_9ACTN|nr:hypothetical protein [Pilimelia anulata]GGK05326.1 hypothetical protein GCM10010123_39000 [Pilimelia anulata]